MKKYKVIAWAHRTSPEPVTLFKDIDEKSAIGYAKLLYQGKWDRAVAIETDECGIERTYEIHPFSLSCEGIWEYDKFYWFTRDEYHQAQLEV